MSPGCAVAAPGVAGFLSPPAMLLGVVPESVAPPPAVVETETSRSVMVSLGRGESAGALLMATAVVMGTLSPSRVSKAVDFTWPRHFRATMRRNLDAMRCEMFA